jgi:8-oxo-dGTP pyrophosphatase MutT (NUDIX family)
VKPTKACPILLRNLDSGAELLVFQHPNAGVQLIKGSIEAGEEPARAALRELAEESGICEARVNRRLGTWEANYEDQVWEMIEIQALNQLPDTWNFHTEDDGGRDFQFFWHRLGEAPSEDWHPVFVGALEFIRRIYDPLEQEK